jgi:hypothetical protein
MENSQAGQRVANKKTQSHTEDRGSVRGIFFGGPAGHLSRPRDSAPPDHPGFAFIGKLPCLIQRIFSILISQEIKFKIIN